MESKIKFTTTIWGIPRRLLFFLLKGLTLFIVWRIAYEGYLKPNGTLDHGLTKILVEATFFIMKPLYSSISILDYTIFIDKKPVITFATGCNGLELLVLYISFLLCYPTNWKRVVFYTILGLIVINVMNVLRCAGLAVWYYQKLPYWDFMHHYLFKMVIYAVNFYLWVSYTKLSVVKKS